MTENSKIEWCDHTFNPWIGCTKVGPGCDHCYAESMMDTRLGTVDWGAGNPRKRTSEANWKLPLKWNRQAEEKGTRYRVFCASLADWLDNEVDVRWLTDLLELIWRTPNLDWLLLSKRIGNWQARMDEAHALAYSEEGEHPSEFFDWLDLWCTGAAPYNVWLGATVVNQEEADRDIGKLLSSPAEIRFLSMEPLLGPVSFRWAKWHDYKSQSDSGLNSNHLDGLRFIDWIIVGGESGPKARPTQATWVRSIRDQCEESGTPFFFKQWGEYAPNWYNDNDGNMIEGSEWMDRMGKKIAGRALDGVTHTEFPVNQ